MSTFNPPETINVLDRHGGLTIATVGKHAGGTLWRPGKVLRGEVQGTLVRFETGKFYQTRDDVTWAYYKVAGYKPEVVVYLCERTGEKVT